MPQYSKVTVYLDDDVTPMVSISTNPADDSQPHTNLLIKSNQFNDSSWVKNAGGTGTLPIVTANTDLGPDGKLTADKVSVSISANTNIDQSFINRNTGAVVSGSSYTGSLWVKAFAPADVGKTILLRHVSRGSYIPIVLTADWVRVIRTEVAFSNVLYFEFGLRGASGGATVGAVNFLVWEGQLEAGLVATDNITTDTTIITVPATYPYLQEESLLYGESKIDFPNGAAGIGQFSFKLLDKRVTSADQGTGFFTALLADANGRGNILGHRVVWLRQQLGSQVYTTQFDGFADDCQLDEDLVEYKVPCRDTRERERTNRIFTKAPASNPTVLVPNGPLNGWGTVPGTTRKLLPPVTPLRGTFFRDANVPGSAGRVKCVQTQFDLIITGERYQTLQQYGALTQGTGLTGGDTSLAFRQVEVWWRAYPGGGAWTKLTNMPAVYGTDYPMNNVFPLGQGTFEGAESRSFVPKGPKDLVNFLINMTGPGIPANNQQVEVMVLSKGQPTDAAPIYWEGNLGQLCKDIYDGVYSDYMPGIRYDAAAMANFIQRAPSGYAILSQPEENGLQWAQENIYKPTGWAPSVPPETGLVTPIQYNLPDVNAPLLQITDSMVKEDAKWQLNKDELVNQVTFQYNALYIRDSKYLTNFADKLGTNANLIEPPAQRIGGIPIYYQEIAVNSQALLGSKELKYQPVTINLLGVLTPNGLETKLWPDVGAKLAKDRTREVIDRFTFGGQWLICNVRRSATGVAAAKMGDWVQASISWLPDYVTDRRGLNRLMQIIAISDDDKVFRKFTLSDAGPNAQATAAPTLGAITQANGVLDIPFSAIPAGVTAQVDYAVAAVEPAVDSGLWTNGGRTTAVGTHILIGPFDPGLTVWVRARGEEPGKRRSAYVASVNTVITNLVAVLNLQLTFDADGHPRANWTTPTSVLGMRVYYATFDSLVDPPALTLFVDADATLGQIQIPVLPKFNESVAIRAVPYPGFAAGAVTGAPGTASDLITGTGRDDVDANMPVAEEITSTVGMVGTLTLQVTDPQNRLTQVEFSHQSGDGAWSAWVVDPTAPYADSVNLLESKTSKIAYRLSAYDENGVLTVFKTNEVSFTLGAVPTIPQVALSISPTNHLIMTWAGDERTASIKYLLAAGTDPTVANIRTGTTAAGRSGSADLGLATSGTEYHVGILAYSGAGATGVESLPAYAKLTWTNPAAAQPLPPTLTISESDITAPTINIDTLRVDAALGIGSAGTLQWRRRTYSSLASPPAWGAFSSAPALPFEWAITRALKWDTVAEAQATDGTRTVTVRYLVMGKIDFLTDNGNPTRAKTWDDANFSPIATNTTGTALHSSVYDSRTFLLNTHFNTGQHTMDNVPEGGTYGKTSFTRLGYADRAGNTIDSGNQIVSGAIVRSRTFQDASYAAVATNNTGLQLHSSANDSRTYLINAHYNTGQHTADNIANGATGRVIPYTVLRASDNSLLTKIQDRAAVDVAAGTGTSVWTEIFDSRSGWTDTGSVSVAASSTAARGTNELVCVGYTNHTWNGKIPFDPNKLYRFRARYRKAVGESSGATAAVYLGCLCYDYQGNAANSNSGANYILASADTFTTAGGYVVKDAWVKGASVAFGSSSLPSTDPRTPSPLNVGTVFIKPYMLINYPVSGTPNGTAYVDFFEITEYDEQAADRIYQTVANGGNIYRARGWDDGAYAVTAMSNTGGLMWAGVTDSRSYAMNTHHNDSVHTLDQIVDGGTYGKIVGVVGNLATWASTTRRLSCSLYQTAAQTISNNTSTEITFGGEDADPDGLHATGSSRIVLPNSLYGPGGGASAFLCIGMLEWDPNATNYRELRLKKNVGASVSYFGKSRLLGLSNSGLGHIQVVVGIAFVFANDQISLEVFQNSGASLNTVAAETRLHCIHLW